MKKKAQMDYMTIGWIKYHNNAAPVDEVIKLLNLFKSKYRNFNISHFHDKYKYVHQGTRSYNWLRKQLQKNELIKIINIRM